MDRFDLHLHSTASDGLLTPAEVAAAGYRAGLRGVALTDHDTVDGIDEFLAAGCDQGLQALPGIELSSVHDGHEIHILGYFPRTDCAALRSALARMRAERLRRAARMVDKARRLGMAITLQEVQAAAGNGAVGRPHLARVMKQKGYVRTVREAFAQYLEKGRPVYVERYKLTPVEAARFLKRAGAVTVLAHAAVNKAFLIVPQLLQEGLAGLEVYHPEHTARERELLLGLAARHNLVVTGGSDYHGDTREGSAIGSHTVGEQAVQLLKKRALLSKKGI